MVVGAANSLALVFLELVNFGCCGEQAHCMTHYVRRSLVKRGNETVAAVTHSRIWTIQDMHSTLLASDFKLVSIRGSVCRFGSTSGQGSPALLCEGRAA